MPEDKFGSTPDSFQNLRPRSLYSSIYNEGRDDKAGQQYTGGVGMGLNPLFFSGFTGYNNISRNPARRFYDPEITTTAIYLPRNVKQRNRWNRWFYAHDEMIGSVFDLHAELPYSRAEIIVDDPAIRKQIEECIDKTNFFSMLPLIDLEFMKIGEVFIHTLWDDSLGMWRQILIHNPDFMEVRFSPFADQECVIELKPDEELRSLIHSTKPEEQQLKRKLPKDVVRRVLTGKNIVLKSDEITHIARRNNPYDVRGTSIIERLYRCHVPGTVARMADGSYKNIEDVSIDDFVLSKDGEKRKVLDTVYYDVNTDIIDISMHRSGVTLSTTPSHKYLIRRDFCSCDCGTILSEQQIKKGYKYVKNHSLLDMNKTQKKNEFCSSKETYEIMKLEAKDILESDRLLVPINNDIIDHPKDLNLDTARLLGYFIAEGSITEKHNKITFSLNKTELSTLAKDIVDILKQHFNISAPIYKDRENSIRIVIAKYNDFYRLRDFIRLFIEGDRSWNKCLKEDVLLYNKDLQREILKGEARGDGWYNRIRLNECRITTTSKKLAEQLEWLFLRTGFYNILKKKSGGKFVKFRIKNKNEVREHISISRDSYDIRLSGKFARKFIKFCWARELKPEGKSIEVYDLICKLYSEGTSYSKIAKTLNSYGTQGCAGGLFYTTTIISILKNKGYNFDSYIYGMDHIENDDHFYYVPISKITKRNYVGRVHDITVDTNHWWLAGGRCINSNTLMYEDKLREAQITISDNFIYPLKLFKLGDPQKGWIPDESHQRELAKMLQEANFDPNFSLIYHYGLQVEYITVAEKVMRLDKEWTEINERKMIGLGVSKQFVSGESSYASANVGLQIQLARYKAKRDLFETRFIRDKFFRVMAERNGWYKRDAREILGHYRVKRSEEELNERVIIPDFMWHKKLMMRDDQAYLTFLNNVYAQGKGPVSAITMMMAMGLSLEDELKNKRKSRELEEKIGAFIHPPAGSAVPGTSPMPAMPAAPTTIASRILDRIKYAFSKKDKTAIQREVASIIEEELNKRNDETSTIISKNEFTGNIPFIASKDIDTDREEKESSEDIIRTVTPIESFIWKDNLKSPHIPQEVVLLLTAYDNQISALRKKNGNFHESVLNDIDILLKPLVEVYVQGKLAAYNWTGFLPIYKEYYSNSNDLKDFSDIVLSNEFEEWVRHIASLNLTDELTHGHIRDLANTCFCYGQLKGFQEQGIYNVKISNVLLVDGFRYKVAELLNKGRNLGSIISPRGEIIMLVPCIEGFDDDELANSIDPHIKRYRDFVVGSIKVKDCPLEYAPFIERYLNKFGKYLKNNYTNILFVKDVVELDSWSKNRKAELDAKYRDKEEKLRNVMVANELMQEYFQKKLKTPAFAHEKTLHISNWIGMEDCQITENLIKYIELDGLIEKAVYKNFKTANCNLTIDEINTYKVFEVIDPVTDSTNQVVGWKVNQNSMKNSELLDRKLIHGMIWDSTGHCIKESAKDPMQAFNENIRLWVDYPHKLDDATKIAFNSL